jgi:glycosyltransferase involved in cell wall biosynthesis
MHNPAVQAAADKRGEMPHTPFFTVFTATYNRAHTLHRVFDSLRAQTFRDFEWMVVDDGSTDSTPELVASWIAEADFPIRYYRQPNSGKHIAHNFAVREARGFLFAELDSDDALVPCALERIHAIWLEMPETGRNRIWEIGSLCQDQHGNLIGGSFPQSPFDADFRKVVFVHKRFGGEKWGVGRTDVLRQHPFPEIAGANFVPEGLIGLQIAREYKTRYVNEVFRIYYVDDGATGASLTRPDNLAKGAQGRFYYYVWLLNNEMDYFLRAPTPFVRAAAMLPVVARYAGQPPREIWRELKGWRAKLLFLAAFPLAHTLRVYYAFKVSPERPS